MEMPKLDKSVLVVTTHEKEELSERVYWHSRTPIERLQAMELLREANYGKRATSGRLQRILEITRRE